MIHGWRYRLIAAAGVAALTLLAVLVANHSLAQTVFTTHVPLFWRLDPTVLTGEELQLAAFVSVTAVLASLIPLFKPQPRRILDTVALTQQRVVIAGLVLAGIGYFNWTYRLPRATLVMLVALLCVVLPGWFVAIRRPSGPDEQRALIVGDDAEQMTAIRDELSIPVLGYVCPSTTTQQLAVKGRSPPVASSSTADDGEQPTIATDGGEALAGLDRLGGLSQLETILTDYDVDTVVLAFETADRGEFFGTLDLCHEYGVRAKVHRAYADDVLTATEQVGSIVDVDVEPWDPQDYVFKRVFDVAFASVGLLCAAPLIAVIAVAIKLDSPGPVFYEQERTAGFGETFSVYKFRTMIPEGASTAPVEDDDNDRITRVGRVLRKTHMDEIPQLWAIFTGQMSVVGPRAAWTEEEKTFLEREADTWRKRWFVKPGLTGLAQINDVKSTDPGLKIRHDVRYIREQSFWLDLKIVTRQIWMVVADVLWMLGSRAGVVGASEEETGAGESEMPVESESPESELVDTDRVADSGDD